MFFFPISGQTLGLHWWNLFSNIFCTHKIAKLSFFNFGRILSSKGWQLHYNTDRCRTEEISLGCFSIRRKIPVLFDSFNKIIQLYKQLTQLKLVVFLCHSKDYNHRKKGCGENVWIEQCKQDCLPQCYIERLSMLT